MNTDLLLVLVIVLAVANLALIVRLMARASSNTAEQAVRAELRDGREEAAKRDYRMFLSMSTLPDDHDKKTDAIRALRQ